MRASRSWRLLGALGFGCWSLFAGTLTGCTRRAPPNGLAVKSGVPPAVDAPLRSANEAARRGTCDERAPTEKVTFVHVNDLHAHYFPESGDATRTSPYARLRGYFEQVRRESPHALFTNAGDDHEKGSVAELHSRGVATAEITQAMRFDVRTLGNHDFAWGDGIVRREAADPFALVVASNVTREGGGFGAKEYGEIRVGCLTIGFVGLVTQPFDEHDKPFAGAYLPGYQVDHEVVAQARRLVATYRSKAQILVLVSHLGKEPDEKIATEIPGFDVILGGHSHDDFDAVETVRGNTAIVQAGHSAKHVARLDLTWDKAARRIARVDYRLVENGPALPVDEPTQRTVDEVLARHAPNAQEPIGTVSTLLKRGAAAEIAGRGAMSLLHADAALVRETVVAEGESIPEGPLDRQRIATVYPVQRQPPDTPGFTSFYTVDVGRDELAALRKALPRDTRFVGPRLDGKRRSYRLAVPKALALGSDPAPGRVVFTGATAGCEAWEGVVAYARERTAACRYLDNDKTIPDCVPTRN